jgi:hypothetical protein
MEVPRPGLGSATHLPCSAEGPGQAGEPLDECRASAGATVKDQPEPVSKMSGTPSMCHRRIHVDAG